MKHAIQVIGNVIVMLCLYMTASAYDFEIDGMYYTITSMSDLEVEVTYNPSEIRTKQVNIQGAWWEDLTSNHSYTGRVQIPSTVNYNNRTYSVTAIGEYAFGSKDGLSYLVSRGEDKNNFGSQIEFVKIPNTVKTIKKGAFRFCNQLKSVEMGESLKEISSEAFNRCPLTDISFPSTLQSIDAKAFVKTDITQIDLSFSSLHNIGSQCFAECNSLTSAIVGPNVKNMDADSFKGCSKLVEIFMTAIKKPIGFAKPSDCHQFLEIYVPSVSAYGFGREYLTFSKTSFEYTGQAHIIEWSNNLKAYKCEIAESECRTEVNAGEYAKYLKATYSDGIDFTVEIPYEYTINKAPMTLAVNDVQREYGEPNPAFTCDIAGFVNGETAESLGATPSFECEANQMSKVGDYRILASLDAPNYEITYKYGTLSVKPAPLTVSVNDAAKIYGNENPEFSLSYIGLKNGETMPQWSVKPTIVTDATVKSGVGQFTVSASGGEAQNYEVTKYNPGTLTVSKRDLTAKAIDCERLYDEENPPFEISYLGFVNGDSEASLTRKPVAECAAAKSSNAGTYPIVVTGGEAENYNFLYQDGTLKINPLTVGFKDVYNSVTYMDMAVSTSDRDFNYIPQIIGPYDPEDFTLQLWFLDKDNKYPTQHVTTISSGDYKGDYVNTNADRTMYAGKYIVNLISKGNNPNVVANPSRAYVTVNRASTNLEWNESSPIEVKVGENVDLGISYQADLWCQFKTNYNDELIKLTSESAESNHPQWHVTGLKEGTTTLYFVIECRKNDFGFYDFANSSTLSKVIKVIDESGIEGVTSDGSQVSLSKENGRIVVVNKKVESVVRVFTLQGLLVEETEEAELPALANGLYVITVEGRSFKVRI